ncbi:thiamine pyrophosphokinase [Russula aff. rugulosa BPL654]|nr:thiamine pyrophosphokinase [Russula aff. rugulosa BPL654]
MSSPTHWSLPFLQTHNEAPRSKTALIILNQPFSKALLRHLWHATDWHCCADGGANRLHDVLNCDTGDAIDTTITTASAASDRVDDYLPDLLKGDLDSVREDVRRYYETRGVRVVQDDDQNSTDLMKCIRSLQEKEEADGVDTPYDVVLLCGFSGRLDQTVHLLSYLHKLRKSGRRLFAVADENVGWVLDEGKHRISIDHSVLGPTCGLLPVGVDSTVLTTTGLRWNLTNQTSGFDGLLSTSNHLVPDEDTVYIETSRPIWWVAELRQEGGIHERARISH